MDEELNNPKKEFVETETDEEGELKPGEPGYVNYNYDKLNLGEYDKDKEEEEAKIRLNLKDPTKQKPEKEKILTHKWEIIQDKYKGTPEELDKIDKYIEERNKEKVNRVQEARDKSDKLLNKIAMPEKVKMPLYDYQTKDWDYLSNKEYIKDKYGNYKEPTELDYKKRGKKIKKEYELAELQDQEQANKLKYLNKIDNTDTMKFKESQEAYDKAMDKQVSLGGFTHNQMMMPEESKEEYEKHKKWDFTPKGLTAEKVREFHKNGPEVKKDNNDWKNKKVLVISGTRDKAWAMRNHPKIQADMQAIKPDLLIHGGATGVDWVAGIKANRLKIPTKVFKADWSKGASAGPLRNKEMMNEAERLKAAGADVKVYGYHKDFEESKGTKDAINKAKERSLHGIVRDDKLGDIRFSLKEDIEDLKKEIEDKKKKYEETKKERQEIKKKIKELNKTKGKIVLVKEMPKGVGAFYRPNLDSISLSQDDLVGTLKKKYKKMSTKAWNSNLVHEMVHKINKKYNPRISRLMDEVSAYALADKITLDAPRYKDNFKLDGDKNNWEIPKEGYEHMVRQLYTEIEKKKGNKLGDFRNMKYNDILPHYAKERNITTSYEALKDAKEIKHQLIHMGHYDLNKSPEENKKAKEREMKLNEINAQEYANKMFEQGRPVKKEERIKPQVVVPANKINKEPYKEMVVTTTNPKIEKGKEEYKEKVEKEKIKKVLQEVKKEEKEEKTKIKDLSIKELKEGLKEAEKNKTIITKDLRMYKDKKGNIKTELYNKELTKEEQSAKEQIDKVIREYRREMFNKRWDSISNPISELGYKRKEGADKPEYIDLSRLNLDAQENQAREQLKQDILQNSLREKIKKFKEYQKQKAINRKISKIKSKVKRRKINKGRKRRMNILKEMLYQ